MRPSRPRVLHTIETVEPGGAETVCLQLAQANDSEFEPLGLFFGEGWVSARFRDAGISYEIAPLDRAFDVRWILRVKEHLETQRISLIQSHEFTANCYVTAAARLAGIPIVCTTHGKLYYANAGYRRVAYRWVSRTADRFVAVSEDLAGFLTQTVNIRREHIEIIHNGVDLAKFAPDPRERNKLRRGLGLSEDDVVVIVVAALFPGKGHDILLDALTELGTQGVKLLIAGDGDERGRLELRARTLGLGAEVSFLGQRSDVPNLLRAADVFILPSYSEGLPLSVIEAMASGVPVVATRVGGIPELVIDGHNGVLVPPGSAKDIASALSRIIGDNVFAARIVAAAKQAVREAFSLQQMRERYASLYRSLIK
jgi:glycosyltransferase involved in cell wall biosynthesis